MCDMYCVPQKRMEIKFWIFFGWIRLQPRKGLYQGHVSWGNYTRNMSGSHPCVDLQSEPSDEPILA